MTLALSGKSGRRKALLAGAGIYAVLFGFLFGLSSQGEQPAAAISRTFMPVSVSCSEDFFGGLFFATDNDPNPPGTCASSAAAVGGSPDGSSANVETDDSAEGDTAMGDDDLVVRFDLSALSGYAIASATLKVWSSSSNAPGLLKAGSTSSGDTDSRYGAIGPGSSPANYSNANLRQDIQYRGSGLFEVNLSMFCVGPSDDCGALVDAVQLELTFPEGAISKITKTHDGDGAYNRGESFNWTIAFEVTGGNLPASRLYRDLLPPARFVVRDFSFARASDGFRCYPSGLASVDCLFEAPVSIPPGLYSVTFAVTVLAGAACGPVVNTVYEWLGFIAQGPAVASDTVEISCGTGTPTPTATATATETPSPTVTATTSQTVTATQTPTPTRTSTSSSTATPTPGGSTLTATSTPTPGGGTSTATSTPTRTATPSATPTVPAVLNHKLRGMLLAYDGLH